MNKNTGLNLELEKLHRKDEDWQFGAASVPCIAQIPAEARDVYMPLGELQNIGEEKMDCASRAPLNILECKFNYLVINKKIPETHIGWLKDNGYIAPNNGNVEFSDAFVAINSGTTRQGNSLIAPLDAIRKQGLIPKALLPQGNTFAEHHNPQRITEAIKKLGLDFLDRFSIHYERVSENQFETLLDNDLLDTGGFAWPVPVNGEYPRTDNQPNHAFAVFKKPKYYAFDNYLDTDNDFVKKLAPNYDLLDFGYRLIIGVKKNELTAEQKNIFSQILEAIARVLSLQWLLLEKKKNEEEKIVESIKEELPPMTPIEPVHISRIKDWAEAITLFENTNPIWNNPGAIKGTDGKFLRFPTYEKGFDYLQDYLRRACTDKHPAYIAEAKRLKLPSSGDLSLLEFQKIYSPSHDNNNPIVYSNFVAKRLNVPIDIRIKELL